MTSNITLDASKYTISTLNIISSNKINQKTIQIQRILGLLPPSGKDAPDKNEPSKVSTRTVVAISAKAQVASKLITIVEILKREIAKRAKAQGTTDVNGGQAVERTIKLYQYSAVSSTTIEVKPKPAKQEKNHDARVAPSARADDTKEHEQNRKRKRVASSQDSTAGDRAPAKKPKTDESNEPEEEAEDDAFEVAAPKTMAGVAESKNAPRQEREVGVLTVYLSLTPIPELAEAHGEQTS